jgi:hypothetical protein
LIPFPTIFQKHLADSSSQFGACASRRFQFHKRSQYFIGAHDEPLSVAIRVNNPNRSPTESTADF